MSDPAEAPGGRAAATRAARVWQLVAEARRLETLFWKRDFGSAESRGRMVAVWNAIQAIDAVAAPDRWPKLFVAKKPPICA